MRSNIKGEAKLDCFNTLDRLLELLFEYEQEYFKIENPDRLDLLT